MKKFSLFRFLPAILMSLVANVVSAHDFVVDGIYYNITSSTAPLTVAVSYQGSSYSSYSNEYTGSVSIPSSVTYNGNTYSVTSIGSSAFRSCSSLTSISIPNSVTSISSSAFYYCSSLTSVSIPASVTSIGSDAFSGCNSLSKAEFASIEHYLNGISFSGGFGGNANPLYKAHHLYIGGSEVTNLVIPNSMTSVGSSAFNSCTGLLSVSIPTSVTSIGSDAFSGCTGLTRAEFASIGHLCSMEFGNSSANPLYYAHHLYIGGSELTDLVIPNSVTNIGSYAFYGCSVLTSVTIPASVTSIGASAFNGCNDLTSVTINSNAVASKTYSSSSSLANIFGSQVATYIFGGNVQGIGSYACYNCSLTSVTIPASVTSIGNSAFYGCTGLLSVTIPNSVTSIGSSAFYNTRLKSVTIGTGVLSIGTNAFGYSSSSGSKPTKVIWLTNTPPSGYTYAEGTVNYVPNDQYTSLGSKTVYPYLSSLFEVGGVKFVPVSPSERTCDAIDCNYDSSVQQITIGQTVSYRGISMTIKNVKSYLCYQNPYLTDVVLDFGGSVSSYVFSGCTGLTSVSVSSSVTNIGSDAFYGCSALTKAEFASIAHYLNGISFSGGYGSNANPLYIAHHLYIGGNEITNLVIPTSVTSIASFAFYGCSALTSVTIPTSVTSIGSDAFYGCTGLTKAKYASLDHLCSIQFGNSTANPLYYVHHLYIGENEVTDLVIPNSVISIGSYAFNGCSALTSLTIPNSVTTIGGYAFEGCSGLTTVTIPKSMTSLGGYAFYNCPLLTSVTINSNAVASKTYSSSSTLANIFGSQVTAYVFGNVVTSIGKYACYNSTLTSVTIGSSVASLGDYAFYGCSRLASVTIPNSVTSIGTYTFSNCTGLTSVTLKSNTIASRSYSSSSTLKNIFGSQVRTYVFGTGVQRIGSYACYNCSLTSVTIGSSVTGIGSSAFYGCGGLTSVSIPGNVTSIGSSAFYGCSGLSKAEFASLEHYLNGINFSDGFGSYSNPLYRAHHLYIGGSEVKDLVIPNSVTSVGSSAFCGCTGLTSVTISNSVTSVGSSAFEGCSGLSSVTIGNSVPVISSSVFSGCTGLTSVAIPGSVMSIGSSAFYGCTGLSSVSIPTSVTSIGSSAFSGCRALSSVSIPGSVTSIGSDAFAGCSALTKAEFASIVHYLNNITFDGGFGSNANPLYRAHHLYVGGNEVKKITIPTSVTGIGNYAFYNCAALTSVTIPNSVTNKLHNFGVINIWA